MLDFDRFEWISFRLLRHPGRLGDRHQPRLSPQVLRAHGIRKSRAEVLALHADAEPRVQQSGGYLEYRRVLRAVMAAIGAELGLRCTESELDCLGDSLPGWPVFPDTVDALDALKARYKLAVISNVDDDLFAGTAEALGVEFDAVVTAQQVRSYKPDLRNFDAASARMGVAYGTGGCTSPRACTMTSRRPTGLA